MRLTGIAFLVVSAMLGLFSYWGIYTPSGQRRFDEMAGMIPFGAGVLAGIVLIAGGVFLFLAHR